GEPARALAEGAPGRDGVRESRARLGIERDESRAIVTNRPDIFFSVRERGADDRAHGALDAGERAYARSLRAIDVDAARHVSCNPRSVSARILRTLRRQPARPAHVHTVFIKRGRTEVRSAVARRCAGHPVPDRKNMTVATV